MATSTRMVISVAVFMDRGQLDASRPARQHSLDLIGRDREANAVAVPNRCHRHTNQFARGIDHRPAAVAVVQAPSICTTAKSPSSSCRRLEIEALPIVMAGLRLLVFMISPKGKPNV